MSGNNYHEEEVLGKAYDARLMRRLLGYVPSHSIEQGLDLAMDWYRRGLA